MWHNEKVIRCTATSKEVWHLCIRWKTALDIEVMALELDHLHEASLVDHSTYAKAKLVLT